MWRGENGPRAFQAPVDVHASADGQVYMFRRKTNECAASSDDEELGVMELRPRDFQDQEDRLKNVPLLVREVLADDNLSKLALQYGCKVADIKRVNNLMQEQDLFALKFIKIPVQQHSFLTETFSNPSDPQEEMPHASQTPVVPQNKARAQPHIQEATDFLMEVDNDINKLIQTTTDRDEEFLDNSQKQQHFGLKGQRRTSYGADWGINWWNAVVAMLLIGIVLPLFYIIYKTKGALQPKNTSVMPQG
ncbi:lysM and putative peptidoglycan-binding domain-containing protein 4 [Haplochromis burtoni]|uniref:LysM and putative peptidoglycan-binding domain-containing protein 4 n=1 Tax=Haplochromis burtoni TaxID=8153 RepID=A0A3Q2X095_HAPBU|nr:lysM and putative peptidoglycan-binding domain-containing protein 4 [Haplochromis burtoni]XP_005933098.1 lysM and putative peptidoglycan-binding domain-containing protein 4 [Haplochromis burtoni]